MAAFLISNQTDWVRIPVPAPRTNARVYPVSRVKYGPVVIMGACRTCNAMDTDRNRAGPPKFMAASGAATKVYRVQCSSPRGALLS